MSHLTTETKVVYTPVLYDEEMQFVHEYSDYDYEEDAVLAAKDIVAQKVESENKFYFCNIEKRVVPIYK